MKMFNVMLACALLGLVFLCVPSPAQAGDCFAGSGASFQFQQSYGVGFAPGFAVGYGVGYAPVQSFGLGYAPSRVFLPRNDVFIQRGFVGGVGRVFVPAPTVIVNQRGLFGRRTQVIVR